MVRALLGILSGLIPSYRHGIIGHCEVFNAGSVVGSTSLADAMEAPDFSQSASKACRALLAHIQKTESATSSGKQNLLGDANALAAETPMQVVSHNLTASGQANMFPRWLTLTTKKHIHQSAWFVYTKMHFSTSELMGGQSTTRKGTLADAVELQRRDHLHCGGRPTEILQEHGGKRRVPF